MAAKASEKKSRAKSKVAQGWLGEAFEEHWRERLRYDKARPRFTKRAKPKR